jgi:small subunit ribosomal protein S17e
VSERISTSFPPLRLGLTLINRFVPDVSALAASADAPIEVDSETKDLLKSLGMESIPTTVQNVTAFAPRERKGRYVPGAGRA